MFDNCSGLEEIDLSDFNTEKVKYMQYMFSDCINLTTIYAGENWSTDAVVNYYSQDYSQNMFTGCTKLKGSMGTTYDSNFTNKAYAHIDGGASNPGYLSEKKDDPVFLEGDVDGDGEVNVSDVTALVSMILGNIEQNAAADVNGDGAVDVSDVTALVSIILGQ